MIPGYLKMVELQAKCKALFLISRYLNRFHCTCEQRLLLERMCECTSNKGRGPLSVGDVQISVLLLGWGMSEFIQ